MIDKLILLRHGTKELCPIRFITELPKDKIVIATDDENLILWYVSRLPKEALAQNQRLFVDLVRLTIFEKSDELKHIAIEELFKQYNVYQLDNISDIVKIPNLAHYN